MTRALLQMIPAAISILAVASGSAQESPLGEPGKNGERKQLTVPILEPIPLAAQQRMDSFSARGLTVVQQGVIVIDLDALGPPPDGDTKTTDDTAAMQGRIVPLSLFPDAAFAAVTTYVREHSDGGWSWFAELEGISGGYARLSVGADGKCWGRVDTGKRSFLIQGTDHPANHLVAEITRHRDFVFERTHTPEEREEALRRVEERRRAKASERE